MRWKLITVAIVLFLGRLCLLQHSPLTIANGYEALAHIWIGILFTIAYSERFETDSRRMAVVLLGITGVVELALIWSGK